MVKTRNQVNTDIRIKITDELNRQNTAVVVRYVLEQITGNFFNLADDELTVHQITDLSLILSAKADLVNGKVPASQLPEFSSFWGVMAKAANDATTVDQAIASAVAALVDASPAALDTLNELAAALGDDPNFATTITNQLANKINTSEKAQANGLATLGADGKVPASQLPPASNPATTFIALTDTPASYAGLGGKIFRVNAAETGLEAVDMPTGGGSTIPKTRTVQTGATIIFNQSTTQTRSLTGDLTITGITNPVQGETIRFIVTSGGFNLLLPSNVDIRAGAFAVGAAAVNYIMLDCVDQAANKYIATIV